jgi:hypothetical protein
MPGIIIRGHRGPESARQAGIRFVREWICMPNRTTLDPRIIGDRLTASF